MASIVSSYHYTVDMSINIDSNTYTIPSSSIKTIIINHNYDGSNMPTLYLKLRIGSTLYNKMVINESKATISFRLFRFDSTRTNSTSEPYIEDLFTYAMSTDPNYNESFEQYISGESIEIADSTESYLEGFIGLISLRCVNDNRKLFNDIIKDSDLISMVHKYTNHMTMCIEPFENNQAIDQFIIPPLTSITNLMEYFNDNFCFYKSGYRFFRDFNTTYLLSVNGEPVKTSNNKYNTVIISIRDPLDDSGKINSMEIDRTNHAYIIYVDANDTSIKIDKMVTNQYNTIIGVDTLGNIIEEELELPASPESSKKVILERVPNDNLTRIYNTKNNIESSSVIVMITKTEIDSSILTPNKEYQLRNYSKLKDFDGRYILTYKKEIMYQQDNAFISSVMFGLRKVYES